jgi:hypothetical protein
VKRVGGDQQLTYGVGRTCQQATDRLVLAASSRHLTQPECPAFMVTPETLLRSHRELVRRKWALRGWLSAASHFLHVLRVAVDT